MHKGGRFGRTIVLPEGVAPGRVCDKSRHGVLQITQPASSAIAPKRIEIQAGGCLDIAARLAARGLLIR